MKVTIGVLCLLLGSAAAHYIRELEDPEWLAYKVEFGKEYDSPSEELERFKLFCKSREEITEHNKRFEAGLETFEMGLGKFSDRTDDEIFYTHCNRALLSHFLMDKPRQLFMRPENFQAPDEVNWVKEGLVTPVKDQKNCGSCWAFSTIGSLEGQWKRKTGKLVSLSQQQLVDCSRENNGCCGGWMYRALKYIKDNGGIESDSTYEYTGVQGECRHNASNVVAKVEGLVHVPNYEDALRDAVASVGPITVGIAASREFLHFKSGIFSHPTCSGLSNHGVVVVGYTDEYWLVKNSWGTNWGEDGYVRIARGKNMCNITSLAVYPLV